MDKAGKWLRASSDRQDELNQEQGIDAYIAARGYELVKTYVAHDKSASKNDPRWELTYEHQEGYETRHRA